MMIAADFLNYTASLFAEKLGQVGIIFFLGDLRRVMGARRRF